jgi:GH24 family phage-related lysozyme (muramidase)
MNRKPVFDAVRRMLGRGFRKSEVAALDVAIDRALGVDESEGGCSSQDSVTSCPCLPEPPRTFGPDAVALIKAFEGCERRRPDGLVAAYPDPGTGGSPWTIGWGATGAGIGPGTVWTQAQCDARLEADLVRYAREVDSALGNTATTQAQFDALVSFHYNTGAIRRATLTRRHVAGRHADAAAEFARWNRAGGRVLSGLTRRRAAEARLYREGAAGLSPA